MAEGQRPRSSNGIAKDQHTTAVHTQPFVHIPDVFVHSVRIDRGQVNDEVSVFLFALFKNTFNLLEEKEAGCYLIGPELGTKASHVGFMVILTDLNETMETGFDKATNGQRPEEVLMLVDEIGCVTFEVIAGIGLKVNVGS